MREVHRGGEELVDHEQASTVNPQKKNLGAPRRKTPPTAQKKFGAPLLLGPDQPWARAHWSAPYRRAGVPRGPLRRGLRGPPSGARRPSWWAGRADGGARAPPSPSPGLATRWTGRSPGRRRAPPGTGAGAGIRGAGRSHAVGGPNWAVGGRRPNRSENN